MCVEEIQIIVTHQVNPKNNKIIVMKMGIYGVWSRSCNTDLIPMFTSAPYICFVYGKLFKVLM